MKYFIDTNIFLRTLGGGSEKQIEESARVLELVQKNQIDAVTSSIVLAEVNWTLRSFYNFSKEDVVEALEGILNLAGLYFIETFSLRKAIEIYKNFNIKYIDSQIAVLMREHNIKHVISFDKDFDEIRGIKRAEPGEFGDE